MRGVLLPFVALVAGNLCCPTYSQAQSAVLSWPEINLTTFPKVTPTLDPSQRTRKHGQAERDDFEAATKANDQRQAATLLAQFIERYPDSSYRDAALFLQWWLYGGLKDNQGQLRAAENIVGLPAADAMLRTAGFVTLSSLLSPYVRPDDPEKERKLADLDKWTQCGTEASAAEVKPANMTEDAFQKRRQYEERILVIILTSAGR